MAERLADLLRREADALDVPRPNHVEILEQGRRQGRRRVAAVVGGIAAALVVATGVGVGATVLGGDDGTDTAGEPGDTGVTFAVGTTVYLDGGAETASIDDKAVKSLYYTSAGLVVRHGNNGYSDGGGPQRFSLVTPDGDVRPLSVVTEEAYQASDPSQPYLAWATSDGDAAVVHVWDVESDVEAARVRVAGASARFLPISIDDDTVYVGGGRAAYAVDWRTGDSEVAPLVDFSAEVTNGEIVSTQGPDAQVRDVDSGEVLLEADTDGTPFELSPDGRYARVDVADGDSSVVMVYDVSTGDAVTLDADVTSSFDLGWTPGGDVFSVDGDTVTTCDSATGDCTDEKLSPGLPQDADIRLGGRIYES